MKTIYLILIYALFFVACDSNELISETEMLSGHVAFMYHKGDVHPFNSANVYDYSGQVHSDIFNSYYDLPLQPSSLDSIIALVEREMIHHDYFISLPHYPYNQFTTASIDSIINEPNILLKHALDSSPLSIAAKVSFENFLDVLFLKIHAEEGYALIYDFIIGYETFVINSKDYGTEESAYILTVTSISRHGIYNKDKKPKPNPDPDWDWLTTCIVGSINGAVYGVPESIDMALKTGIGAEP